LEKPPIASGYYFHSFEVCPIRSQPCSRLQKTLLGVTLLEDLITLLGVALSEVFGQFNRTTTLLVDLQMAINQ